MLLSSSYWKVPSFKANIWYRDWDQNGIVEASKRGFNLMFTKCIQWSNNSHTYVIMGMNAFRTLPRMNE